MTINRMSRVTQKRARRVLSREAATPNTQDPRAAFHYFLNWWQVDAPRDVILYDLQLLAECRNAETFARLPR